MKLPASKMRAASAPSSRRKAASPSSVWTSLCSPCQRNGAAEEPITDPDDLARLPEGPAKGPWYNLKGFFEHKLAEPNVYDKGKIKGPMEALRMPNLHLTKEQIQALTTFLLGSQQSSLPESYQYVPGDSRRDIQEGWWIIKKYNCMGCHQFIPGQRTVMMGLPQYQDAQEQLPPKLFDRGRARRSRVAAEIPDQPGAE